MTHKQILSGDLLLFKDDPFKIPSEEAVHIDVDGALLIENGRISARGSRSEMLASHPDAKHHAAPGKLICPGFIDAHAHYPQTAMIASWGKRLIDWLNTYTFPEEMRFADPNYAREISARLPGAKICAKSGWVSTRKTVPEISSSCSGVKWL